MTDRDAQQVQRAMLADIPIALIVAELERRGYTVVLVAKRTVQEIADVMANADDKRPPWLAKRWLPLADDDGPLPFEVGDE